MSDRDAVLEAFTELSTHYEQTIDRELQELWGVSYSEFIGNVVHVVPNGRPRTILDVATGTAQIPLALASLQPDSSLVGLDLTPAMLQAARTNVGSHGLNDQIRLVCASAMDMPFPDGYFDTVVCGLAMHHMDVPHVLTEIVRVLRQGGTLILADVNTPPFWRSPIGNALIGMASLIFRALHNTARARAELAAIPNLLTADEWRDLLARSGLNAEVLSTTRGRRPMYPQAVLIRGTKK